MVKLTREEADALLGKCFAKEDGGAIRFVYVVGAQILGKDEAYVDGMFCMLNEKYDSWHATNISSLDQDTMKHWEEAGYKEISTEEFVSLLDKLALNMQKVGKDLKEFKRKYDLEHGDQKGSTDPGDDTHKDK